MLWPSRSSTRFAQVEIMRLKTENEGLRRAQRKEKDSDPKVPAAAAAAAPAAPAAPDTPTSESEPSALARFRARRLAGQCATR